MLSIIFILLLVALLTYLLTRGDFMSPIFLLCITFLFSLSLAYYMQDEWGYIYNIEAGVLILLGFFSFLIGYFVISLFLSFYPKENSEVVYIFISNWKIVIYSILAILFTYLYFNAIVDAVGDGSWIDVMAKYRYAMAYSELTGERVNIPEIIALGRFIVNSTVYILVYVSTNNYILTKKVNFIIIIAILVGLISTLIGASRLDLVRIPISFVTIYYILKLRVGEFSINEKNKLLIRYFFIFLLVIFSFSFFREIVGRTSTAGFVDYIAHYIGAPNVLLSEYLNEPKSSLIFGKESFWGINNFIGKLLNNPNYIYDYTLEFREINGYGLGNVYTAFRMYYADFGLFGVFFLDLILGMIFAFFYISIRKNIKFGKRKSIVDFRLLIYSMIIHSIILAFYADWFFSQVLAWGQIKAFIFMWLIKLILVDFDKRNKRYR